MARAEPPIGRGRTIDVLRSVYALLVAVQAGALALYGLGEITPSVSVPIGLSTALAGPLLSLAVSVHIFRHPRRSRGLSIAGVGATYIVTCASFAIIYWILAVEDRGAFALPAADAARMDFGTALYFSLTTITTTGFGDIAPLTRLARFATCLEIITGLLYQVFIFSLAASVFGGGTAERAPARD